MSLEKEDFTDVEDYSDSTPSPAGSDSGTEHDQLPSVEEVKMANNYVGKGACDRKCVVLYVGLFGLVAIIFGLIVGAVVDNPEKRAVEPVANVTAALHEIAVNGEADFQDKNSYRYHAWWQLINDDMVHETYSHDRLQQRYGMYCLYHSTSPETWIHDAGWKRMGVDECKWYGVMCDESGMVTRIGLRSNGLGGRIPEEVSLIPKLEVLNVNDNEGLTGHVPSPICEVQEERKLDIKVDCTAVACNCCANC